MIALWVLLQSLPPEHEILLLKHGGFLMKEFLITLLLHIYFCVRQGDWGTVGWHTLTSRWHPQAISSSLHNVYSKSSLPRKLITQPKLWKGQVTLIGKSKQELQRAPPLKALSIPMIAFPSFRNSCISHPAWAPKRELSVGNSAHHILLVQLFNIVCLLLFKE